MPRPTPPHGPDALDRLRELVDADLDGRPQTWLAERIGWSKQQLHRALTRADDPALSTVAKILAGIGRHWKDLD